MNLSTYLKQKLKEQNITQKELAGRSELSLSTISRFINNPDTRPALWSLVKLADGFDISVAEVVHFSGITYDGKIERAFFQMLRLNNFTVMLQDKNS